MHKNLKNNVYAGAALDQECDAQISDDEVDQLDYLSVRFAEYNKNSQR